MDIRAFALAALVGFAAPVPAEPTRQSPPTSPVPQEPLRLRALTSADIMPPKPHPVRSDPNAPQMLELILATHSPF